MRRQPQPERLASSEAEWRLPNGEDLISFALGVGLAAEPLLRLTGEAFPPDPAEWMPAAAALGTAAGPESAPDGKG